MDLIINSELIIPSNHLSWRFSRASGPGGQKINKKDIKVELILNLKSCNALNKSQKTKIRLFLKTKLINDSISITVKENRTQYQNRQIALIKLASIINKSLVNPPKERKLTKPTLIANKKRLDEKKKRADIKKIRREKDYFL